MRKFKFGLAIALSILVVSLLVFVFCAHDRYVVPILMYHNVENVDPNQERSELNTVTPKAFAWQMKFLKKHHYNVISFDDYVDGVKRGRDFARNTVVIHFDDGFEDNYTQAFPILKENEFPATIFLISDNVGKDHFLKWEQIKEMEKYQITFGGHTRRHPHLPDVSLAVASEEIVGCKKIIEEHLGHPIFHFVYPSGGFTDDVKAIVKKAGFIDAGTTNRGRDIFNRDLFELNRIRPKSGDTAIVFWAKLSGYYNLFRAPRGQKDCRKD